MIRLVQIGFLALTALFLALTVYYYPIPAIAVTCLIVLVGAAALKSGVWP